MARYKNDYTREEDVVLCQLHEIRHQLAEQHQSPDQINEEGLQVMRKYKLNKIKIVSSGNNSAKSQKEVA